MRASRIVVITALTFVAGGGLLSAQSDTVRARDSAWIAPTADAARANPLTPEARIVAGGAKLYRQRCDTCHGEEGRGTSRAPSLVADAQSQTDGGLFWKLTTGNTRAGMPSFSFLPATQRWQLILHLRELGRAAH